MLCHSVMVSYMHAPPTKAVILHEHALFGNQVRIDTSKTGYLRHESVPGIVVFENGNYVYSLSQLHACVTCNKASQCLYVEDDNTYCVECLTEDTDTRYMVDAECGLTRLAWDRAEFLSRVHISEFMRRVYDTHTPTKFCRCCKVTTARGCCTACVKYARGLVSLHFNIAQVCIGVPDDVIRVIHMIAVTLP